MKVLKATEEQYQELNGYSVGNNTIEFTKDINGNWIIGLSVLSDKNFSSKQELNELVAIEFEPIPDIED